MASQAKRMAALSRIAPICQGASRRPRRPVWHERTEPDAAARSYVHEFGVDTRKRARRPTRAARDRHMLQTARRARVWPGAAYPLGANFDGRGVNFALFSEHATRVELCLFDGPDARTESIAPTSKASSASQAASAVSAT